MDGMDCSGFVQEVLSAGGVDPAGDQTAQGLYNYFEKNGSFNRYGAGSLAFFGESALKVTHVAFCVDSDFCIEAGGGGSGGSSGSGSKSSGSSLLDRFNLSKFIPKKDFMQRGIAGMSVPAVDGMTGPNGPSIWEKSSTRYQDEDSKGRWVRGPTLTPKSPDAQPAALKATQTLTPKRK
jgi:hypothetical protein